MGGTGIPVAAAAATDVSRTLTRIARGETLALSFVPLDDEGDTLTVTSPTLTVRDSAGALMVAVVPTVELDGSLTAVLAAGNVPLLDTYSLVWAGVVGGVAYSWPASYLELVGGHPFAIHQLRALSNNSLADTTKYPTATLKECRVSAEQRLEHPEAANVAFVPRGRRATLYGDGSTTLPLPTPALRSVYSASIDGTALTPTELAELVCHEDGRVYRAEGWPRDAAIVIHWEHGYDMPSGPAANALMLVASEYAKASNLASRATGESTDIGFIRYSIASRGGRTGIPDVDAVIADERRNRPVVG